MKNSLMFLLGSGTSISAKFPSTFEITNQVLTGDNIYRHTDGRYYLSGDSDNSNTPWTNDYLPNVLRLLQSISQLMGSYNKQELLNYEIIYYFVQQLHAFESGDLLNMTLYPFLNQVKDQMLLTDNDPRLIDILNEAENYVRHTVWRMLQKDLSNHEHLAFLSEAMKDKSFSVSATTLNHDLLIEKHLTDMKIKFHDGFGSEINGVRYWENNFSDKNNLLKVHGSIDWFTLKPDGGDWFDEKIGIVLGEDIDHLKSPTGMRMRSMPEKEPKILIGTFNKIYEYTENIFSDIYYQFRALLGKSHSLVISGYGFRDKGINNAILEWLYSDRQNRIVVIHPNPDVLLGNEARQAVQKAYTGIATNNFLQIPKYIEETSWEEIKAGLI